MAAFARGADRHPVLLLPDRLDDDMSEDDPVRAVTYSWTGAISPRSVSPT